MEHIGTYILYLIMACAVIGAVASLLDSESELGKEFTAGLHSIGPIFIPVAGTMAAIPFIASFISQWVAPLFAALGRIRASPGPSSSPPTWAAISSPMPWPTNPKAGCWG